MINERYNELLQAIARIMATKNVEIDKLHEEIKALKDKLHEAEEGVAHTAQKGKVYEQ
ncbi:MAG: hypothetical protein IKT98_03880 [Selenomonadaceae bacterium]|nr:hypothetical protein [Selenomonadaceae bacterium]